MTNLVCYSLLRIQSLIQRSADVQCRRCRYVQCSQEECWIYFSKRTGIRNRSKTRGPIGPTHDQLDTFPIDEIGRRVEIYARRRTKLVLDHGHETLPIGVICQAGDRGVHDGGANIDACGVLPVWIQEDLVETVAVPGSPRRCLRDRRRNHPTANTPEAAVEVFQPTVQ